MLKNKELKPGKVRDYRANSPSFTLHIGRHKTGTTSLQEFLALNDELLAKRFGILYPVTGRDKYKHYHHSIFAETVNHNRRIDSQLISAIIEEAATKNAGTILLSSEMLSRRSLNDTQLTKIKDAFSGHKIKIIMYLRRQDTFLLSTYANRVKIGILAAPETIHDIDACLDYAAFTRRYERIFGHEAIIVRSYDNALRSGIFEDFLNTLGVKDCGEFMPITSHANQRLPWRYIELLRVANKHPWRRNIVARKKIQKIARWLNCCFPVFMDNPKPLDSAECKSLIAQYEDKNDEVARLYLNQESLFS